MQQATDFKLESEVLATLLEPLADADFNTKTQFKNWTINDVLGHLHMFNVAADITLRDGAEFQSFFGQIAARMGQGMSLLETQYPWLDGLSGRALFDAWRTGSQTLADNYERADPKARVKWAGPDMSAKSSITARQMETWAHGQEVFDILGADRLESDRIKNIVYLGVNTFGWTYSVRKMDVPEKIPHLALDAPSGAVWNWGDFGENSITGSAVEFAQVVTQVRNIADTSLKCEGPVAREWMSMAQCFAGGAENPPAAGTRFKV